MKVHVVGSLDNNAERLDVPFVNYLRGKGVDTYYLPAPHGHSRDKTGLWGTAEAMAHWMASLTFRPSSSDDALFFCDFWNPSILALAYARWAEGLDFKMYGVVPASSLVPGDFAANIPGASLAEASWVMALDKMIAPSAYARSITPGNIHEKVVITGLPLELPSYLDAHMMDKENIVLYPHRPQPDKTPAGAVRMLNDILTGSPETHLYTSYLHEGLDLARFGDRIHVGPWPREEYLRIVKRAAAVPCPSMVETWGYGWMEAALYGCKPITSLGGCYPELSLGPIARSFDEITAYTIEAVNQPAPDSVALMYHEHFKRFADVPQRWAELIGAV